MINPTIAATKVIVDTDPDYPDCFSIYTDTDGINAELAGKIADKDVADRFAELWNKSIT